MLREMLRRLRYWLSSDRSQRDLQEEMRLHLSLRADKLVAGGMSRRDAELAARRQFGNQVELAERSREPWVGRWIDDLGRDVRTGWRGLRRSPGFTFVVLLTLALGVGANGAIFQLVDVLGFRKVPVAKPEQLTLVQLANKKGWRGSQEQNWPTLTNLQWEYLRDHQDGFAGVAAWFGQSFGYGVDPRPVRGVFVSGGFFEVLGVPPILGRVFRAEDDRRGCGMPGVVLSHVFWQTEFGGDPGVIGRTVTVGDKTAPVVGVVGPAFTGLEVGNGWDLAVPICSQATLWNAGNWLDEGAQWWITVVGRKPEGRSLAETNDRLRALSPALFAATLTPAYPKENAADYLAMQLVAKPASGGVSSLRDRYANPLILLLAATGLVLLLTSANLGNMVLARASARSAEFGLRLSLGATRGSLLRQLLVENAILALGGSVAGFVLATGLSRSLVRFLATQDGAPLLDLRPTGAWVGFTVAVALASCAVFGLLPAWRISRAESSDALRATSRVSAAGPGASLRQVLVVVQVALSLMLVFGALLFQGTLTNVLRIDPGFNRFGVVTSAIDFSRIPMPVEGRAGFRRDLLETLRAVPGVESAAETAIIPLSGDGGGSLLWKEGSDREHGHDAYVHRVGGGYFGTMAIPIVAGRDFDERDVPGAPKAIIVNQFLAAQLELGDNPIGQQIRKEANPWVPETTYEVVGVVKDSKYASLKEDIGPTSYFALTQEPAPSTWVMHVIRSRTSGIEGTLGRALKAQHSALGVSFRRLETTVDDRLLRERLLALVSGCLGALSALIAAVGLYGVIAYMVARRTHEIGIRLALGATTGHIVHTVTRHTVALVVGGIAIGLVGALLAGQATRAMLFGLEPADLPTLAAATAVLLVVALAAGFLPARRAATLDALTALRRE